MPLPRPKGALLAERLVAAPPGLSKPVLKGISFALPAGESLGVSEAKLQILQLRKDFREQVEQELREVRAEILDLRERVAAARFVLDHLEVRAPEAGVVVGLQV